MKCLPPQQQEPVRRSFENLQKRWNSVANFAPLHLLSLQFRAEEFNFHGQLNELEKQLGASADSRKPFDTKLLAGKLSNPEKDDLYIIFFRR